MPAILPPRISAILAKKVRISVTVSRKQNVTRNRKSLYLDNAKNRTNEGNVTHTKDVNASGIFKKYVHRKKTAKINTLPMYISQRIGFVSFFSTVNFI